jgi:cytidylate kinase
MIVAVDGPAAAGKSTAAKGVARALNIMHLDTGAMYRAVALGLLKNKVNYSDLKAIESFLEDTELKFYKKKEKTLLLLNNMDITKEIRSSIISKNASEVSTIKIVREYMVKFQRKMAKNIDCILEGRDIGTVVFPNADFKFFITANYKARARRRLADLVETGDKNYGDFNSVLNELNNRDLKDSTRSHSPLVKAEDAIEIDTTNLTINEVIDKIVNTVNQKRTLD